MLHSESFTLGGLLALSKTVLVLGDTVRGSLSKSMLIHSSSSPPPSNVPCAGQTIRAVDEANVIIANPNTAWCSYLSIKYRVTTGDLQEAIGTPDCTLLAPSYCIPKPCMLAEVTLGETWFV